MRLRSFLTAVAAVLVIVPAGTASAASIKIARTGSLNLLRHAGILPGDPDLRPTQWLDMPSSACFTFAEDDGLVGKTGLQPIDYRVAMDGVLAARHVPGLIKAGDCLSVIATVTGEPCR